MVDVRPIRKAVEESGVSLYDIANQLGWTTKARDGAYRIDSHRVKRTLGISRYYSGKRDYSIHRKKMSDDLAVRILDAINKVPTEVGL